MTEDARDWLLPAGGFLFLLLLYQLRRWGYARRRPAVEALARRHALQFLDTDLPGDFPSGALDDLPAWDHARHVVSGRAGKDRIVAFDAEAGLGQVGNPFTVVARKNVNSDATEPLLPRNLRLRSCSGWRVVTYDHLIFGGNALMKPEIIEKLWHQLA